ncbi:MAG: hypothetical protein AB1540_10835 [Bdellovibrionota bacterium]
MKRWISIALFMVGITTTAGLRMAHAIQLDWSGQFWFDNHWLNNYQLDRSRPGYDNDPGFRNAGSPYVPGVGEKNVVWYSAFFRLKPKVIVNDSVDIRSELHLGSPIYGFLGRSFPSSGNEPLIFTNSSRDNFVVGAQRYWANLKTDFGTIELGRAPIDWGLGGIWDAGDDLFDRYQSTGDMIRLTSKFGNFYIQPALVKVATGNNVGGATINGNTAQGHDDITDYDLAVKYDNSEDDFEFGMMWTKRTGNPSQKSIAFARDAAGNPLGSTRINYNLFDFYAKKKWKRFWIGGELPLFNGDLGAIDGQNEFQYKAFAVLFEGGYTSDVWDVDLKAGHVPGQPPGSAGDNKFRAIYLNRNYDLGLIMFHYNLYGLSNNNPDTVAAANLNSPYDATIVNANYFSITPKAKLDKWTLKGTFAFAFADEVATANRRFYNHESRQFFDGIGNQSSFMGWEMDYGLGFQWDENVTFGWDFGFFFPGDYFAFTNLSNPARFNTDFMFASQVKVGITF